MMDGEFPLSCEHCSAPLERGRGQFYGVSIVAVADPSPPVFTEADMAREVGREIDRIVRQMHDLGEREAVDQVYRRKQIYLCLPCYQRWIENPTGK